MGINIRDCFVLVYMLGWAVIAIGIFMVVKAGLSGAPDDMGIGVIFGGMFMVTFVRNTQLKMRIIELERELEHRK